MSKATRKSVAVERTCVICGCTDSKACAGGCSWVVIHPATATGVCSNCDEQALHAIVQAVLDGTAIKINLALPGLTLRAERT